MKPLIAIAQFINAILGSLGVDLYDIALQWRLRKMLPRHAKRGDLRTDGLTILTYLSVPGSILQVARDFIEKLTHTNIPFSVVDMTINAANTQTLPSDEAAKYREHLAKHIDQRLCISFIERSHNPRNKCLTVVNPAWCEVKGGLDKINPDIASQTFNIVTFTDFCYDAFKSIIRPESTIFKIRYPSCLNPSTSFDRAGIRHRFSIPTDAFVVFFNFSLGANFERKNPDGALKAFAEFANHAKPRNKKVILAFKLMGTNNHPEKFAKIKSIASDLGISHKVIYITELLSHEEILNLTGSADVYLSLHRSEGLGIGMVEAMSLGVPVIATGFGGNTDFVNESTAFVVPFKMCPVAKSYSPYAAEWAEPDVHAAASHLIKLYTDPTLGTTKAKAAQELIATTFSAKRFESDIRSMMSELL